jgi:hypothetical protein
MIDVHRCAGRKPRVGHTKTTGRAVAPAYHGNVPGNCAVDLGYGRWQSCDSLGPR